MLPGARKVEHFPDFALSLSCEGGSIVQYIVTLMQVWGLCPWPAMGRAVHEHWMAQV